jgi:hypothetical protein
MKVIVRIKGGLGNQLFCYAAARRLAVINDCELVIDNVSGFKRDFAYNRRYALTPFNILCRLASSSERLEPFGRITRAVKKTIANTQAFENRSYVEQEFIEFDKRLLDLKPKSNVYLDGLWQSEHYFKDIEDIIRNDLKITSPNDKKNKEMAALINQKNAVSLHVRWFNSADSASLSHNLSINYYKKAIAIIESKVSSPHFFLFSDDPNSAKKLLGIQGENITVVEHNQSEEMAYADLWLMSQCKFFITANSTFSWWGAWLSQYKDKLVLTPNVKFTGLTAWGFEGLIPDNWVLV